MPASLDRIRKTMDVQPTAKDKGLTLTVRVVAYDSGLVSVDKVPVNDQVAANGLNYDQGAGFLGAADVISTTLLEFYQQVQRRREELS
jgi:hypothetical protein